MLKFDVKKIPQVEEQLNQEIIVSKEVVHILVSLGNMTIEVTETKVIVIGVIQITEVMNQEVVAKIKMILGMVDLQVQAIATQISEVMTEATEDD